jgi:hypothetical protein
VRQSIASLNLATNNASNAFTSDAQARAIIIVSIKTARDFSSDTNKESKKTLSRPASVVLHVT